MGPLIGSWGGEHVGLALTASGGTLEYDCAAGTIDGPVRPDGNGRFLATGSHTPGTGGPEQIGSPRPTYTASYSGQVTGEGMTLSVNVPSRGIVIGPYRLRRGAPPKLLRCL